VVGDGSVVAAGCVIGPGKVIPPRSLVAGVPGKIIKTLSEEDEAFARGLSGKYERLWHNYLHG
jgi:carbonic anhydrase/acetyltransferase-like protein (isoleucine patch superfamily)